MDEADRRFYSRLGFIFGPLFVLGGFLAAFTIMGALFIWAGLALVVWGAGLRLPIRWPIVAFSAFAVFVALSCYTVFVYPG